MNAAPLDAIPEFLGAMEAAGVKPLESISASLAGGGIVRFRADGDKPGRRNGWAVLHLDGRPAGAFGCYRLGVSERWRAGVVEALSPAERRARRRAWDKARAERETASELASKAAAERAASLWESGVDPDPAHPYLARKGLPGEGLRQSDDVLLAPMYDARRDLWNVQRIFPDGTKRFLKGGRVEGLSWRCGKPDGLVCVGEGVGTMSAVRKATGHAVAGAFTEKNLGSVARLVHATWPDLDIVVCADDDAHLVAHPAIRRNLGLEAARSAALAVGGRLAVPPRENA